jgi:hypothetical protein
MATLAQYSGSYSSEVPNRLPVVIELAGGHLTLTPQGKRATTLVARSDHEFYIKEWEGEAEFLKASDGSWILNIYTLPDQTMTAMKRSSINK